MLKRIGTVGTAGLVASGSATASGVPETTADVELDVADVSGTVSLESVLSETERARLPADVDPAEVQLTVDEDAESIRTSDCCCCECTAHCASNCPGGCCYCP